eukprot:scaffold83767_cov19-Tisochrysis_lutea.AAC.1
MNCHSLIQTIHHAWQPREQLPTAAINHIHLCFFPRAPGGGQHSENRQQRITKGQQEDDLVVRT